MRWQSVLIFIGVFLFYKFGSKFVAYTYLREGAFFWTAVGSSLIVVIPVIWWLIRKHQIRFDNISEDFSDPKKIMNYVQLILVVGLTPWIFYIGINVVNVSMDKNPGKVYQVEVVKRRYSGSSSSQGSYYIYVKGLGNKVRRLKIRQAEYFNRFAEQKHHLAHIRKGALGFAYVRHWSDLPKSIDEK
jgi:hypothetical protein